MRGNLYILHVLKALCNQQYDRATYLMKENKNLLESIANVLLEKENIDQKEISEMYNNYIEKFKKL